MSLLCLLAWVAATWAREEREKGVGEEHVLASPVNNDAGPADDHLLRGREDRKL